MRKLIAAAFFLGVSLGVQGSEKISDLDNFESQYIGCMKAGFGGKCLSGVLSGRFDPWFKKESEILVSTESFYIEWLGKGSVYKIHFVKREDFAGVFENRNYLIERSDGALAGIVISFRKVKGDWHIYDVQGGFTDEFIRNMLDMQRVSVRS